MTTEKTGAHPADSTDAIRKALAAEFRAHGLYADDIDVAREAPGLLHRAIALAFPEYDLAGHNVDVVFDNNEERARIEQALLFGWVTAEVLAQNPADERMLCALFNLFIGMIDGVCDTDAENRDALLSALLDFDPESSAIESFPNGRMLACLPPVVAADPAIAFIARVIDAFYSALHTIHPASIRKDVGHLLAEALAAEQTSIAGSAHDTNELLEASRKTSVLPFVIMATLAQGDTAAATRIGEAMWRIDDLIDMEIDSQSGALNSLLLNGLPDQAAIDSTAREAAEYLRLALGSARGEKLLSFIFRYAGITPESSTRY